MRIIVAIIFLLHFGISFSQEKEEKLNWQEDRPLTWEDFKAIPDNTESYSANTNSGMSYSWNYSTASGQPVLEFEVFSNFYPGLSWVKQIENEDYLLAHEQLHFDISELHARKLRKALDEYEIGRSIRQDLKRIYNSIDAERSAMQNQFDRETSHSENRKAEMQWREFVKKELAKLQNYSS